MKKLFFSLAAIVALFATSCTTDASSDVQLGGEGKVTFSLQAKGLGSRAINDGTKATELTYAIYDDDWDLLDQKELSFSAGSLEMQLTLDLVKNQTYNFVFWAQSENADCYTLNLPTKGEPNVEVDYSALASNNDELDAFFGKVLNLEVKGTVNETVELRRPFAQINFGTDDLARAAQLGFNLANAKVSVTTKTYNKFYLSDGRVDGEMQNVTFTDATPIDTTADAKTLVTGAGNPYHWVSMNYILWPDATDLSLSTCELEIKVDGREPVKIEVPGAPARRNWRTNLVGSLLTDKSNIQIIIKPEFDTNVIDVPLWNGTTKEPALVDGVYQITSPEELAYFFGKKLDKSATLVNDINLAGKNITPINGGVPVAEMAENGRQVFDGNGKTILNFNVSTTNMSGGLFATLIGDTVKDLTIENATVVVDGNGEQYAGVVAGKTYGAVVLENVTVKNSSVDGINKVGGLLGHAEDAALTITNCVVENTTVANHEVGTRAANPDAEVGLAGMAVGYINATGKSTIEVAIKGCTMNVTNGRGTKDRANGKVVGGVQDNGTVTLNITELDIEFNEEANGYVSTYGSLVGAVRSGTPTLNVTVENTPVVWKDAFAEAVKKGGVVAIVDGEYDFSSCATVAEDVTVRGLGDNVNVKPCPCTYNGVKSVKNITFENVILNVPETNSYSGLQGENETYKNCVINGQYWLYSNNVVFEDCTFNSTDADNYNVWTYGAANVTFTNCELNSAGKSVLVYKESLGGASYNVTLNGCTLNASAPVEGKAAVEIDSSFLNGGTGVYNVTINNTTANGFADGNVSGNSLWNQKKGNNSNISVDGELIKAAGLTLVDGYTALATNAAGEYCLYNAQSIADWHDFIKARYNNAYNKVYRVLCDIDANNYEWSALWVTPDSSTFNGMTVEGDNHTISNLKIVSGNAMFVGAPQGSRDTKAAEYKNLTFKNVTSTSADHFGAVVWADTYGNVTFDNVHIVNSTVSAGCNVAAFVGGTCEPSADKATVFSFNNCSVEGCTLTATGKNGQDPNGASGFVGRAFGNTKLVFTGSNVVDDATVITSENGLVGGRVYGFTTWANGGFAGTGACDGFVNMDGVSYVETSDLSILAPAGSSKKTVEAGTTVVLSDDISNPAGSGGYGVSGLTVSGGVLDGAGHTLTTTGANGTWDAGIYHNGGTVKNITVGGSFRGIFTAGCVSDINVENVVIDNVCYTFNSDAASANYSVNFTNTVLNGWTSFTKGYKSVNFTGCTFSQGTGGYKYAYCRPYMETTFTNCDFNDGATEKYEVDSSIAVLTFVNCRYNGVALTSENIGQLVSNTENTIVK